MSQSSQNPIYNASAKLPIPYYQDEHSTIYCGDCRDILPLLEPVDLVLTDPPYGIGEAAGLNKSRGNLAIAKDYGSAAWDDKRIDPDLLLLALGLSKYSIVFGGNYYTDILTQNTCWIVWDKENGENDFADCELAWTSLPEGLTIWDVRQIFRIKKHIPFFHFKGILLDFRGWK